DGIRDKLVTGVQTCALPILHVPRHPLQLTRFGTAAAMPAAVLARAWKTPQARALFGGVAAHALSPLTYPMSSAVGMALICAGHKIGRASCRERGWVEGGARA